MTRKRYFLICSAIGYLMVSLNAGAAEVSPLRKIRAAITSISGSMVPPWAAHEAGIFKKYGLQVEVIATPSGVQGTNALIAGEVSFVQIAGGTTTGAAVGGADCQTRERQQRAPASTLRDGADPERAVLTAHGSAKLTW